MHTKMSTVDLLIWLVVLLGEFLAFYNCRSIRPLRLYLLSEFTLGATLLLIARTLNAWTYFHFWIAGLFIHEILTGALLVWTVNILRLRALRGRTSWVPIQLGFGMSFGLGIYTSSVALNSLAVMPYWKLILSWDHAFWYAICCMMAFTPLYSFAVSSTMPRPVRLIALGIGIYATAEAGLIDRTITWHAMKFSHVDDAAFFVSLVIWYLASRSEVTTRVPDELEQSTTSAQIVTMEQES